MRSRVRTRTHGSVGRRELRLPLTRSWLIAVCKDGADGVEKTGGIAPKGLYLSSPG